MTGLIGFGAVGSFFVGGGTLGPPAFFTAGGGTGFFCCSTTGYLTFYSFYSTGSIFKFGVASSFLIGMYEISRF